VIQRGDLVKRGWDGSRSPQSGGLVLEILHTNTGRWVRVLWPGAPERFRPQTERFSLLEVISENR